MEKLYERGRKRFGVTTFTMDGMGFMDSDIILDFAAESTIVSCVAFYHSLRNKRSFSIRLPYRQPGFYPSRAPPQPHEDHSIAPDARCMVGPRGRPHATVCAQIGTTAPQETPRGPKKSFTGLLPASVPKRNQIRSIIRPKRQPIRHPFVAFLLTLRHQS